MGIVQGASGAFGRPEGIDDLRVGAAGASRDRLRLAEEEAIFPLARCRIMPSRTSRH